MCAGSVESGLWNGRYVLSGECQGLDRPRSVAAIVVLIAASAGTVWSSTNLVSESVVSGRSVYPGLWVAALVAGSSILVYGLSWLGMSAEGPRFSRK